MKAKLVTGAKAVGVLLLGGICALGLLAMFGMTPLRLTGSSVNLPRADTPPLEFAYLDAARADAYLGQAEDGLASSEQRTEQLKRSVTASLEAGSNAQLSGSEEAQQSTSATVAPTAADRFYTFLRLLRIEHEADYRKHRCNTGANSYWLGEVDDQQPAAETMKEVACIGVGDFVRISNAQLFLPPFAQALKAAQSVNVFYGALPAPRTAFTSPTQSTMLRAGLQRYEDLIGTDPRMPFVASPFGSRSNVGHGVTFFLPALYDGLTTEPSLLSGSVTIVGKVIYYASAGQAYIDYPTISTFGRALLAAPTAFLTNLGVCSTTPTTATRSAATKSAVSAPRSKAPAKRHASRKCATRQQTLYDVKKAVTLKSPMVVVLPLAIYG